MLFSSILFPLVGVFRSFRLFLSFALSNYLPPCLSLTHTHSSSSTDGSAAFLFQGSRQQSSHYRNKTTRRSALWKKEKLREARVALLGEERDHGGSGSPDRPYHLVRNRHHMSKQRDREKEERNYYVARPETMIRLVEHAATNNNIRTAKCTCTRCLLQVQRADWTAAIDCLYDGCNRCRLFCHQWTHMLRLRFRFVPEILKDSDTHLLRGQVSILSTRQTLRFVNFTGNSSKKVLFWINN